MFGGELLDPMHLEFSDFDIPSTTQGHLRTIHIWNYM